MNGNFLDDIWVWFLIGSKTGPKIKSFTSRDHFGIKKFMDGLLIKRSRLVGTIQKPDKICPVFEWQQNGRPFKNQTIQQLNANRASKYWTGPIFGRSYFRKILYSFDSFLKQ